MPSSVHVPGRIERAYLTASRSFLSKTRRLPKASSAVPEFKRLADKFLQAKKAKASASANATMSQPLTATRRTSVSARRAVLTEKAKEREELLKAKAALEQQEKVAKAEAARARKDIREAKAAAERAAAEERLRIAEMAEQDFKRSLDELADVLNKFSIGTAHTRRGNPWQRRELSPVAEGGTRRTRKYRR